MPSAEERAVYWSSRMLGLEAPCESVKELGIYKYMLRAIIEAECLCRAEAFRKSMLVNTDRHIRDRREAEGRGHQNPPKEDV